MAKPRTLAEFFARNPHLSQAQIARLAGIRGLPGHGAYCGSKAAVISYCESLRGELRSQGVQVITPNPKTGKAKIAVR